MNLQPYNTRLIQEQLRAEVPKLRLVGGRADYAAARSLKDYQAPCAYVVLAREKGAKPPAPAGLPKPGARLPVRQVVSVTFGVVVVVRNYREQHGDQLSDELLEILGAVRGALCGFVPDVLGTAPCQWIQGDIQDYSDSTALWVDVYQTQHLIGSEQ
ncbi:phage tail terminator protein [Luteimonas terricola]|uniref:DUF3168 domain-containing protein n=1 Tax=Luteimonas terricola TaxID=645597 RepID=A0ABQ2EHQ6_9GAMM|nr:hypothetical protein [Luteimonas terricola]GGK08594.1 hypothetical protein GCM10011394_17470 [Luteimonas terricola]